MSIETLSEQRCFGGVQGFYKHASAATGTDMRFAVYQPPQAKERPVPVLYYLAGLTCTEETATIKAGAQRLAAEHGLLLVMPDTSPRGAGIVGEDDGWDFGTGAGFYIDATAAPWSANYRMETYVTRELRELVESSFPVEQGVRGIFGHSMGSGVAVELALRHREPPGYGALVLESAMTSMPDLVRDINPFGILLVPLVTQQFASIDKIDRIDAPKWFLSGTADKTVPPQQTQRLYDAAPEPRHLVWFEGGSHSGLHNEFEARYRAVWREIAATLRNDNVAAAIVGASRPEQIVDNVGALRVELTDELASQVEALLAPSALTDPALTQKFAPSERP